MEQSKEQKDIGVVIDDKLSFDQHTLKRESE